MKKKNFIKNFEKQVKNTISKYKLIEKNEKILVALSGGKDSATALFILKKLGYKTNALHLDLGLGKYSTRCLEASKKLCKTLNVKIYVFNIKKHFGRRICDIHTKIQSKIKVSHCLVCGVIKKWILNKKAKELNFDKIVTGHNLDDEAQTIIMNLLKGNLNLGINSGPVTGIINDKKFIPRVKPLFFIPEKDIKKFSKKINLPVVYEKCPYAVLSYRLKTRKFLENKNRKFKLSIVKNFLKISDKLKYKLNSSKVAYCKICNGPSRNEICKTCRLLGSEMINKPNKL